MTRGFPRPRKFVKKVSPRLTSNKSTYSYDPKWDNKEYPIPYSARINSIGRLAMTRIRNAYKKHLCMVCGDEVEGDDLWVYIYQNSFVEDSGPFHEKCVKITQKLCPFVSEQPERFRFVQVTWKEFESQEVPDRHIVLSVVD